MATKYRCGHPKTEANTQWTRRCLKCYRKKAVKRMARNRKISRVEMAVTDE